MKKLFIVTVLSLLGVSGKPQSVLQIGGTGVDVVNDCALDAQGNLYVTGMYQGIADFGNGFKDTSTNATHDFFAAKYDRNNQCQWASTFGTAINDEGVRLFVDYEGNLYTVIRFADPIQGSWHWGFGQIDSAGHQTWNFLLSGGQYNPVFSDFKSSSSQIELLILPYNTTNFTLRSYDGMGNQIGSIPFSFPFTPHGSGCLIHLVLNKSNGAVVSSKVITYPNTYLLDARFERDSIIIAGGFIGSTTIGTIQLSAVFGVTDGDGFIAAIDTANNCSWAKSYSTGTMAMTDAVAGILLDSSRIYFFNSFAGVGGNGGYLSVYDRQTGITTSNNTQIEHGLFSLSLAYKTSRVNTTMFVNDFACDLVTLQEDTIVNLQPFVSTITAIAADSVSVYAVGSFWGTANFEGITRTTIPSNVSDGFIFKKRHCFYGPKVPVIVANGSVLTSSSTSGNQWYVNGDSIPGATSQTHIALIEGTYVVVVSNSIGCSTPSAPYQFPATGMPGVLDQSISVTPNPITDYLTLEFKGGFEYQDLRLSIKNSIGQEVIIGYVPAGTAQWMYDLSGLPTGMYLLTVSTRNAVRSQKILKN